MALFSDDFERANGALGGNWVTANGSPLITSGLVGYSSTWGAVNTTLVGTDYQEATAVVYQGASSSWRAGPAVKCATGTVNGWCLSIKGASAPYSLGLNNSLTITGASVVSVPLSGPFKPMATLRLVWDHGHIRGYVDGELLLTYDSGDYASQTLIGMGGNGSANTIASIFGVTGTAVGLGASESVIGNYGACVPVHIVGSGTAWTAGTPGSPTFTVDHGRISAQTVDDATHATLTYCPGDFLGVATFTDPSTGQTVSIVVTSNPIIAPPSGTSLSQTAIDYIERSAIAENGGTIVNREQQINAFAGLQTLTETITTINAQVTDPGIPAAGIGSLLGFVIEIFDLINGGNNWGGAATVFGNTSLIKSGVDDANTAISDMRGAGGVTLATLAAALSNLRGVGQPSLADVLSAISTPDLGPLSDKLDAMRGDTTTSLYTLLSSLAGIRTTSAYSLGDVMDAIGNLGGSPTPATAAAVVGLVAALALAAPTGGASVAAAAVAVGAGPVLDIATIVELVGVLGELAGIAADVAALVAQPSGGYIGAPVWPGASLVNLGTSTILGSRGTIAESMDGVLVDIDHADTDHKPAYSYDGALAWRNIGCLAFADDQGRLEGYQPFCFAHQTFTPKSLRRAASVRWFTGHGPIGTIRAWTVKP